MARLNNTIQAFKQATPFGITGSALGLAVGLAVEGLGDGQSSAKDYAKMGALGAFTVGTVFQVGGMLHANKTLGGDGVLLSPILGTAGFAGGVTYTRFYKNQFEIKNIMKNGIVVGSIAAVLGAGLDYAISRAN